MTNLTPKQEVTIDRIAMLKLGALEKLAETLGLLRTKVPEDELRARWQQYGHLVPSLVMRFSAKNAPTYSRVAIIRLLDYIVPEWRAHLGNSLDGFTVKRNSARVKAWRMSVLSRDGHRCTSCGRGDHLHAHHLLPWSRYPVARLSLDNGLTLCKDCHIEAHGRARLAQSKVDRK